MIELAYGFDEPVADFVCRHFPGGERGFGPCRAIGFVENGILIGGTVYHRYDPHAGVIEMSTVATTPRWLSPKVLHTIFAYPFELIGVQMVVLQVDASNERMVNIARRFGFSEYCIPRLSGRNEDRFIFTLTDDQWRETKFERSRREQTAGTTGTEPPADGGGTDRLQRLDGDCQPAA